MRFFQLLSRRQPERVTTRATNSSEFGRKLNWKPRESHTSRDLNKHGGRPFGQDIVLSTICILLLDDKKQTKEEEKKRSTWVRPWLARRKERGFYHQLLMEISLAKYSLVASQARAKSCRVATRATISAILSRKFQFWTTFFLRFFHLSRRQFEGGYTCDFHLALATRQNL